MRLGNVAVPELLASCSTQVAMLNVTWLLRLPLVGFDKGPG
jgi:hypothetical protein